MLTNEDKAAADARIGASRALRERSVLTALLRSCFARTQTWLQAGKYVDALVSGVPSRNGWTLAEQAGDRSPARMQRLLNRASWDEAAAMSEVRRYAAAGLDAAARRSRRFYEGVLGLTVDQDFPPEPGYRGKLRLRLADGTRIVLAPPPLGTPGGNGSASTASAWTTSPWASRAPNWSG